MSKPMLRFGFRIRYGTHAREQMAVRRISDVEVRQVLTAGVALFNGLTMEGIDKWRSWGNVDGRTIDVVWWLTGDGKVQVVFVATVIDTSDGKGW